MVVVALLAPWLGTKNPSEINPTLRNRTPGFEQTIRNDDGSTHMFKYRMGTDSLGRDIYSRVIYGARVSLIIGSTRRAARASPSASSSDWSPATSAGSTPSCCG